MEVQIQIDTLIENLKALKPRLTDDVVKNQNEFKKVLEVTLADEASVNNKIVETNFAETHNSEGGIPAWVNKEYPYDPLNPRKPNMREMMEALSGQKLEVLYKETELESSNIAALSSELLYGTVPEQKDNRDWNKIMGAVNVLEAARSQNSTINKPTIDIANELDQYKSIIRQYAVIKDSDGNVLKSLVGAEPGMKETLKNFGVASISIPKNLEQKIVSEKFDRKVLEIVYDYKKENHNFTDQVENLKKNNFLVNTLEAIESKLSQKIPLEELEKL